MTVPNSIRIGARGSALSLRQVDLVADLLRGAHPGVTVETVVIATTGDRVLDTPLPMIGGKGVFTEEIETALLDGRIDLAVHSLKDLPTTESPGVIVGAIPARASSADVFVSRSAASLADLPQNAAIGTSSPRRAAQLRRFRPDFQTVSIRGNVETRLRKGADAANGYDAIVLAEAGLARLGLGERITAVIPFDLMLPAPGQGALAVQCRDDAQIRHVLAAINDRMAECAVTGERAFLEGLGGGCSAPIAALGITEHGRLKLVGRVLSLDGATSIDVEIDRLCASREEARELGLELARAALDRGAAEFLGAAS
jgi:hydroxymethylbilane synthase